MMACTSLLLPQEVKQAILCTPCPPVARMGGPGTVGELLQACHGAARRDLAGFSAWEGWGAAALQYIYVATARAFAGSGRARLVGRAAAFLEAVQVGRWVGEGGCCEGEGAARRAREGLGAVAEPVLPLQAFEALVAEL